jgi:hypothetical protein
MGVIGESGPKNGPRTRIGHHFLFTFGHKLVIFSSLNIITGTNYYYFLFRLNLATGEAQRQFLQGENVTQMIR